MKKLLLCLLIFSNYIISAQDDGGLLSKPTNSTMSVNEKHRTQRYNVLFSFTTIGMEVLQPSLRNNITSLGYMTGPVLQVAGLFEMGALKGMAYKIDKPVVTTSTSMIFFGFKYHKLLTRSRSLNFGPIMGLRFMLAESKDPYLTDDNAPTTFGIGAYGGAFLKLGPITINAKYHADGNINFAKSSNFNSLALYPSIGIAFSPLQILMNPKEFSHTAMAHWETDFKSITTKSIEYSATGGAKVVTRYSATWTDNYGDKTMNCRDVQPFFFIGPRIATNIKNNNKTDLLNSYGVNMGYRRGALFLNAFIEKENVYFGEPFGRSYDTSAINNNSFKGRIDGVFTNSLKYGAQIGLEWVNWFQSKDYIYRESRVKKATANFSIITFAGIGKAHFGDLKFNSDSGLISYTNYINTNPDAALNPQTNILLTKKDVTFFSAGTQIGIGAVALNVEYTIYDKSYKQLNGYKLGVSYNIPVSRVVRALKVANLKRKVNKFKHK